MKSPELVNLVSAIIYLAGGLFGLYVVRKHSGAVRQLPESPGRNKLKRIDSILSVIGLLFLLAGVWKLSRFFISRTNL
jgi:hypothetical protein